MDFSITPFPLTRTLIATRPSRSARGFTLIELMVVVAVLVIVIGIVTPSFRAFLERQQAKGLAYDLTSDLLIARSEALKRGTAVTITPNGGNWNSGWITQTAASERLSTRNQAALTVTFSAGAPTSITFSGNGRVSSPITEVRMTISGGGSPRCVEVGLSGRARSSVGACT